MNPNAQPSSTWFTQSPDWTWYVVGYFFVAGVAAGAYLTAAIVDLVGDERDRRIGRWGYLLAFPLIALGGLFLTLDLGRPERFLHMLWKSEVGGPMLKTWSPMSVGSWLLLLFSGLAFLAFVHELTRRMRLRGIEALTRPLFSGTLGKVVAVVGAGLAFGIATYPGALLGMTNRPFWGDTPFLSPLFAASATASAVSAILVPAALAGNHDDEGFTRFDRFGQFAIGLAVLVLAAMLVTLGPVALALFSNLWGVVLIVGVVVLGLLVPFYLAARPRTFGRSTPIVAGVLELSGSLLLRLVVVLVTAGISATVVR